VAAVPWASSGYRMEIYGTKGTLVATSDDSPQLGGEPQLFGAQGSNKLEPLPVPARFVLVPAATPKGDPFNVGQMYCEFARSIRDGSGRQPDFATAVALHRFVDSIKRASDEAREVAAT
jgi:predicted dehydrogenase